MEYGQADTMVIKDEAGAYYLLPLERLQQGRVPADQTAEVERLVAEAEAARFGEQDDTQGYLWYLGLLVLCELGAFAAAVGIGLSGPLEAQPAPREREWTGRMQ